MNGINRCQTSSHCHHPGQLEKTGNWDRLLSVLEKVSAVALGVFSCTISPQLFLPFFGLGLAVGVYTHFNQKQNCRSGGVSLSCSQGLMEQLTGIKLPAPISITANIAVTVCHIEHHAVVFVPIIGLSLGSWVGYTASDGAQYLYNKLTDKKFVNCSC